MQYMSPQDDTECELPLRANGEQTRHTEAKKEGGKKILILHLIGV